MDAQVSGLGISDRMNQLTFAVFLTFLVHLSTLHVNAKTLFCYFTGIHRGVLPLTDLLHANCSVIVFWSLKLESDLSVQFYTSQDAEYGKQLLEARRSGSNPKIYVGVALFNRDQKLCAKLLQDRQRVETFSNMVNCHVKDMGFDGVMLNLCNPETMLQKDMLGEVIKSMRNLLGPDKGLGMDVMSQPNDFYPIEKMNQYLNWVSIDPAIQPGRTILYEGTDPDYRIETCMAMWKTANIKVSSLIGGLNFVALKITLGIHKTKEYNQICDKTSRMHNASNMDEQVRSGTLCTMITPTIESVGLVARHIQQSDYGGLYTLIVDFDDYYDGCGKGKFPLVMSMKQNMPDDPVIETTTTMTTTATTAATPVTPAAMPPCKSIGKLPAPDQQHYYNCRTPGKPPALMSCPDGTTYNAAAKSCE